MCPVRNVTYVSSRSLSKIRVAFIKRPSFCGKLQNAGQITVKVDFELSVRVWGRF